MKNLLLIFALAACSVMHSQVEACQVVLSVVPNSFEGSDQYGNYQYDLTTIRDNKEHTVFTGYNVHFLNIYPFSSSEADQIVVVLRGCNFFPECRGSEELDRHVINVERKGDGCVALFTPEPNDLGFSKITINKH
jgi:hypothetical protein